MYVNDENEIRKLKKSDKETYGQYGYESRAGYIPVIRCLDLIKLLTKGYTPSQLSERFRLMIAEVMGILVTYSKHVSPDSDVNDIKCMGGLEYSEIQKTKNVPVIKEEDISDVLIDLYLLSKEDTVTPKKRKKKKEN